MAIEFRCSQCNQLLRVPEEAAGKNARCPKCQALMTVPGTACDAPPPLAQIGPQDVAAPQASGPPASFTSGPFAPPGAGGGSGKSEPPKPLQPGNPFGEAKDSPFGSAQRPDLNPYSSPASAAMDSPSFAIPSLPINPRPVTADAVFNYAWQIWKTNLGLLVGVTLTIGAANYAIALPSKGIQVLLEQQGEAEAAAAVAVIGQVLVNIMQMYLGIGAVQINLKLARRQLASFGDLFGGTSLFLPVLGAAIIAGLAIAVGFLLLIVPGVLMILAFWPYYYVIVDRKAGVIESFSVASRITHGNWGSSFVLWLMSVGIILMGCMALCVGVLFAAPLVSMMFAVGYLMMSGQLPQHPMYAGYPAPYQPLPTP